MVKSVLVTGATGFIGNYLVKSLVNLEVTVNILARPTSDLKSLAGLQFIRLSGGMYVVQAQVITIPHDSLNFVEFCEFCLNI